MKNSRFFILGVALANFFMVVLLFFIGNSIERMFFHGFLAIFVLLINIYAEVLE